MTTAELRELATYRSTDRELAEYTLWSLEDLSEHLERHDPDWYTLWLRIDLGHAIEHAAALVDRLTAQEPPRINLTIDPCTAIRSTPQEQEK